MDLYKALSSGEYVYRFLVNGLLELNDPQANLSSPDAADKLWSLFLINQKEERLYNNTQTTVHIEHYRIHSKIQEQKSRQKKVFNRALYSKVVTRFDFT